MLPGGINSKSRREKLSEDDTNPRKYLTNALCTRVIFNVFSTDDAFKSYPNLTDYEGYIVHEPSITCILLPGNLFLQNSGALTQYDIKMRGKSFIKNKISGSQEHLEKLNRNPSAPILHYETRERKVL